MLNILIFRRHSMPLQITEKTLLFNLFKILSHEINIKSCWL